VDLTDLVRDAGVEEDPLGGRGLTSVDVRHDADVAYLGKRVCGGHGQFLPRASGSIRASRLE
jgi:hypothetical protein